MAVSVETLWKVVNSNNSMSREALASRPSLPDEIYAQLAKDRSVVVREALSYNQFAPVSILRKLATSKAKAVVIGLATNASTPLDIIEDIYVNKAQDNFFILNGMARNPALPVKMLHELANSKYSEVQYTLLSNPSLPLEILQDLGSRLRNGYWVMADRRTSNPPEIWAELVTHEKEAVRTRALEKLSSLESDEELYATVEHLSGATMDASSLPKTWVLKLLEGYSV